MADRPQIVLGGMLDEKATKKKIQDQLKGMSKEDRKILLDLHLDEQKIKKANKQISDLEKNTLAMTKNSTKNIDLFNKGLGKTLEITQVLNHKTGELEVTQEKLVTSYKDINKEVAKLNSQQSKQWQGRFEESIKAMQSTPDALVNMRKFYQEQEKLANKATATTGAIDRSKDRQAERYLDVKNLSEISKKEGEILLKNIKKYQVSREQKQEAMGYLKVLKSIEVTEGMSEKQLRAQARAIQLNKKELQTVFSDVRATGRGALNFGVMFESALKSMTIWMSASTVFFQTIRAIQGGVQTIFEFDKAMTELKKVSEESNDTLDKFGNTAEQVGAKVGRTSTEVVQATAEFVKMGYSLKQATKMAEDALILTNVGDGFSDVNEASEALVTTLKGFNMDATATTHIIDSLNELSNKYAVNSVDLAEALKRSSAVMSLSGNTFEESLAMYTAGIEILQSPEKVSRGVTTISQRLRGLSDEGEKLAGLTPKLQEAFDKYAKGIKITADDGTLRSTYDILVDLSQVWGTLTSKQQQYLGELVAGKDQVKTLAAILQNQKVLLEANTVAIASNGSALKENEVYLQSLEGRVKVFNQAMEQLWKNTINSDSVKQVISLGTSFVELADNIGLMNIAITILSATFAIKFIPQISTAVKWMATFKLETLALLPTLSMLNIGIIAVAGAWLLISYRQNEYIKAQQTATQQMNDSIDSMQKNVNTAKELISSVSDLNGVQKLNEQQQARLKTVTEQLQKLYPNMFNNMDKEKDKVGALVEAYNAVAKSALASQLARANADLYSAKKEMTDIEERAKLSQGVGRTPQANVRFGMGAVDFTKDKTATAVVERYNKALEASERIKKQISEYKGVTIADFIPTPTNAGGGDETGGGGKSKTQSAEESYAVVEKDRYIKLTQAVKELNVAIEQNQALQENTTKLENLNKLREAEIALYKQKQKALEKLNIERFKEREELIKTLKASGAKITGTGDKASFENYQSMRDKLIDKMNRERLAKNKTDFNNTKAQLEQLDKQFSRFAELQTDLIPQARLEWAKLQTSINGVSQEISDSLLKAEEEFAKVWKEEQEASEKRLAKIKEDNEEIQKNTEELYKDLASALEKQDEERYRQLKNTKEKEIAVIEAEIDALEKMYNEQEKQIEKNELNKKILDLEKEKNMLKLEGSLDANARIYEIDKELVELKKEQASQERKDAFEKDKAKLESSKEVKQKEIEALDAELEQKKQKQVYFEQAKQMIVKNSYDEIIKIMGTFDSQFALSGATQGQAWYESFAQRLLQAQALLASISAQTDAVISKVNSVKTQSEREIGYQAPSYKSDYTGAQAERYNIEQEKLKTGGTFQTEFANGGLMEYTGQAMIHGTKSMPELALNPSQVSNIASQLGIAGSPRAMAQGVYNVAKNTTNNNTQSPVNINIVNNIKADVTNESNMTKFTKEFAYTMKQQLFRNGVRV